MYILAYMYIYLKHECLSATHGFLLPYYDNHQAAKKDI